MAAYFQDPRERNNEIVGKTPTKLTSHGRLLAMVEKHSPPDHLQKKFMDLYRLGSLEGATTVAEELVVSFSHSPFSWKALGNCLLRSGDYDSARNALETACDLDPSDILALSSLAWTLFKQGELKSAIKLQKDCLELEPSNAQSQFTMASILYHSGSGDDALKYLNEALHLGHSEAEVLSMRSAIYSLSLRFQEGFDDIERLYELAPDDPTVLNNLGNFYKDMANFSKARYYYARALEIDPQHMHAYSNILLNMHYDPSETADNILDMARSWQPKASNEVKDTSATRSKSSASRNIRVGLVSSNFRKHPVGWMITSALKNLPDDIDIIAFSDSDRHDFITQEIKNSISEWKPVYHLNDFQLADNIYESDIDILIDLAGHGSSNRLHTMAAHPAPLIVKWVGSQISSMGIPAFDYFLSDSIETPPGIDHLYTEKLIRLPDDYVCYLMPYYKPSINPLPSISNQYVTLGCFNNPTKVNDELLEEWATLMRDLPASRLLLKGAQYSNPEVRERILNVMRNAGVNADRIILEGPAPHNELLKSYQRVDIALDTWPYSGGLTTCEALMMGVPVVTLPGPTFAGRHSATHLINAGMPELVVDSWKEYRQRVIELASDLPSLAVIRASLRTYLEQSPLCDGKRFGQHLNKALRAIWQRYCDDKTPAALTFNKDGEAQFEDEQAPVEAHYADAPEDDSAFQWQFDGKLIAVDNGGQLLENAVIRQLLQKEAIELIAFDPSSRALDTSLKQHKGVHYYPNVTLGDGRPSQLHACLDPKMSSSLKPLNDEYQPEDIRKGSQVLTKLPLNSIALDSIEGLPAIDWLVLDDLNDVSAILDNGAKALENTLLLQVKVVFQPTHERQPNLAEIQHWAGRNGFRFYRLHEPQHRSHLPQGVIEAQRQATELVSAYALLIPSMETMGTLDHSKRMKLAFLLSHSLGAQDIAYKLISEIDQKVARNFLSFKGLIEKNLQHSSALVSYSDKAAGSKEDSTTESAFLASSSDELNTPSRKRVIHICFNNIHTQSLIDSLERLSERTGVEQVALINGERSIKDYNINIKDGEKAFFFNGKKEIPKVLNECRKSNTHGVIFHGLFFDWQKNLLQSIGKTKKTLWVIWGGDIYNPIKNQDSLQNVLPFIDSVATVTDSDYNFFEEWYGEKPNFKFRYSPKFESLKNLSQEKENIIIVGNSGDPSNCHIEILETLKEKNDIKDYEVIIPLSYNLNSEYYKKLLSFTKTLDFSNSITILTQFISNKEYFDLIARAKILITAHHRSQAGVTINAAFFFGTEVVIRKKISVNGRLLYNPHWLRIKEMGISPLDFSSFNSYKSVSSCLVKKDEEKLRDRKAIIKHRGSDAAISINEETIKNFLSLI